MTSSDATIMVRLFENGQLVDEALCHGPVEFGRQRDERETPPCSHTSDGQRTRFVIAHFSEQTFSRTHLVVSPSAGGRCRLTNRGKRPIRLQDQGPLWPDAECDLTLPVRLTIEDREVHLEPGQGAVTSVVGLTSSLLEVERDRALAQTYATLALSRATDGTLDNEALMRWAQAVLGVLHGAAETLDFYPRAARALVDMIGLDAGRVLVRASGTWEVRALQTAPGTTARADWQPSRLVMSRVLAERQTCFLVPEPQLSPATSLQNVTAVVAVPILAANGEVAGVLYGERRGGPAGRAISRLEGMLVEMLACGIAAGAARVEQEQAALRARVQMEQFFTPELARHLAANPDLLQGRDVEVSMLSVDVRGFSRTCERLGATRTLDWLHDVLDVLSDCVLVEQGVLVDYVGDELLAMWGAPEQQPDHAERACRAALSMLAHVPELDARWRAVLQEPLGLRIGINTGLARVGNIGSARKFKYGALGNTINLASRVQGAARQFGTTPLITETTQRALGPGFQTRRLGQVRVVNISAPVTLYELASTPDATWEELRDSYEKALAAFEAGDHRGAAGLLGSLIAQPRCRDDGPALILLQRAVAALGAEREVSPVWNLPAK
jgi:adenylate cyclase